MNSWFSNDSQSSSPRWTVLLLAAFLAGCGRNDVQVYRVSKDQPPTQTQGQAQPQEQPPQMPAGHPDASGGPPGVQWKLPAGWQEVAPGEMRVGSFRVPGQNGKTADVSIVPLPGMAGRDVDNVNRWRGQVGLEPVSESELPKLAETVQIDDQKGQLYDLAGQNAGSGDKTRILAALLRREGIAWFFKMTGDDELVAGQKSTLIEFLKSIRFSAAPAQSAQTELPPSHPPVGGDTTMGAPAAGSGMAPSGQGKPQWEVPAGWQEVAGGQFLVSKFTISGSDGAQAAVNVSSSAGDGGGLLANVNRWRGQLGLAPISDAEMAQQVQALAISGTEAKLVDLTGMDARTGQKARMIGAIIPQGSQTWFYKLMGNEQVVGQQRDAFTKFVQTAKY